MRKTWKEVFDAWEPVIARLRSRGVVVSEDPPQFAFPVQITGTLADGRSFYFRERGGHAYLGVGGPEPSWTPVESAEEELWPEQAPPGEPFLTAMEFEPVFDRLLGRLTATGWAAVHRAWASAVERLAAEGFEIRQETFDIALLEGVMPNGERFYLRQFPLHETCYLGVGGTDPENAPAWSITERWAYDSPIEFPLQRPTWAAGMLRRALRHRSN